MVKIIGSMVANGSQAGEVSGNEVSGECHVTSALGTCPGGMGGLKQIDTCAWSKVATTLQLILPQGT